LHTHILQTHGHFFTSITTTHPLHNSPPTSNYNNTCNTNKHQSTNINTFHTPISHQIGEATIHYGKTKTEKLGDYWIKLANYQTIKGSICQLSICQLSIYRVIDLSILQTMHSSNYQFIKLSKN
jgi:hypothetical protein